MDSLARRFENQRISHEERRKLESDLDRLEMDKYTLLLMIQLLERKRSQF
jgi:hypothetical protein